MKRLDPKKAGRKLSNYLKVMSLEAQTIARACGKNSLHNLEPEDLCALVCVCRKRSLSSNSIINYWYDRSSYSLQIALLG